MIIVTGGAGFIGSAMIWRLNKEGITDILVVDNLGKSDKWKNLVNRKFVDYVHRDVFLDSLYSNHFADIEAIVHLGACSATTERDADFLMQNNYHFSVKVAQYALKNQIRLINASSAATYGDGEKGFNDDTAGLTSLGPLNMYGYSKHLFDLWAHRSGALDQLVSLKFFNVFGPNEYHKEDMTSVIYKAYFQVQTHGKIKLFKSYREDYADGEQRRDFVYVKDCVEVMAWLLKNPKINGLFNLGTGRDRSWNDLARALFIALNLPPKIEYIDMPEHLKDRYQYYTCANNDKLTKIGQPFKFSSLEASVKDYVCHYLSNKDPYL
jgi:ADP-L-glycero-D-manno-heptose 6-epimerase